MSGSELRAAWDAALARDSQRWGNLFDGMNARSSTSMRRCRPPSMWKRCSSYSMGAGW